MYVPNDSVTVSFNKNMVNMSARAGVLERVCGSYLAVEV